MEGDLSTTLVIPSSASENAASEALGELAPWIRRRRRELESAWKEFDVEIDVVPVLGDRLDIVREDRRSVARSGQSLLVPREKTALALERWLRMTAREEISERLDRVCHRVGKSYTGLSIRDQSTRWASCSTAAAISFNWRLIMAPLTVLDYVVEHEVCHLEIADHSRGFWRLLESRFPDWRAQGQWLRRFGPLLRVIPLLAPNGSICGAECA